MEVDSRERVVKLLDELAPASHLWVRSSIGERVGLLKRVARDVSRVARRWVERSVSSKQLLPDSSEAAEEWLGGPAVLLRLCRQLALTLERVEAEGPASLAREVFHRDTETLGARGFPRDAYDRLLYKGIEAESWLNAERLNGGLEDAIGRQRAFAQCEPQVAVVLGAGNMSSLGPADCLHQLFVERRVVAFKPSPVLDSLTPVLEEALGALVQANVLAFHPRRLR